MKKIIITIISILLVVFLVVATTVYYKNTYSTIHIPYHLCENFLLGVSAESFCQNNGKDTFLEGRYLYAKTDSDGCLIITLKNTVISEWKNTFTDLQILQCVLGDTRDIGITIDYTKDFLGFMERAHRCGFEISEDFTYFIASPNDTHWYIPFIGMGCTRLQIFEGKDCKEVKVEYIEVDSNGEIVSTFVYPDEAELQDSEE